MNGSRNHVEGVREVAGSDTWHEVEEGRRMAKFPAPRNSIWVDPQSHYHTLNDAICAWRINRKPHLPLWLPTLKWDWSGEREAVVRILPLHESYFWILILILEDLISDVGPSLWCWIWSGVASWLVILLAVGCAIPYAVASADNKV